MLTALLTGPARYVPRTPWGPVAGLAASVLILLAFQFAAIALASLRPAYPDLLPSPLTEQDGDSTYALVTFLAISQASIVLLTLWAAGLRGGWAAGVLQIARGRLRSGEIRASLVGLLVIVGAFNVIVYLLWPEDLLKDLQSFQKMLDGPQWPLTVIAVAIGAPLSEELLFRGFLLSALAQTRVGFWPAAIVVNVLWTGLHYGYTLAGLVEVFFAGLYLSWLVWRTGSLWPALVCHAAANIASLVLLFALR